MATRASDSHRFMLRALRLARRGQGYVEPNPMVGAVLVRDGRIVAEGWHRRFGGPHAEVEALAAARRTGVDPAGADLYVTLEPCCHHGKTPPCTDALIAARLGRVIAAMVDPFPQVAGQGLTRLREAGLAVEVGLGEAEARALNEPFVQRVATGRPWVIAKWAQTLDGHIATRTGASQWISGEGSRRVVHRLRARVDAIMVGIGTALADDPALTARGVKVRRVARRVVVDPELRLSPSSRLVASLAEAGPRAAPPVMLAVRDELLAARPAAVVEMESRGVELVGLPPADARHLTLTPLLVYLAQRHGATNVLVEGGSRLLGTLLAQGLIDQVLAFVAPRLLADGEALPAVTGLCCDRIDQARGLVLRRVARIGDDVLLDYRVQGLSPPQGLSPERPRAGD